MASEPARRVDFEFPNLDADVVEAYRSAPRDRVVATLLAW